MAKKTDTKKEVSEKKDKNPIIKNPRITEKAALSSEKGVYTFDVATDTNKSEIIKAIKTLYKVTPVKVNIIKNPAKRVFVRGNWGVKGGIKKAVVYLKKGDKITFA